MSLLRWRRPLQLAAVLLVVATIVLGVLWYLDPAGNYEPATFVLGTVATLIGVPTLFGGEPSSVSTPTAPASSPSLHHVAPSESVAAGIDALAPKRPPLRTTFRDGEVCDVTLAAVGRVRPEMATRLIADFGSFQAAQDAAAATVESVALAVLERTSLKAARLRRSTLEAEIRDLCRADLEHMGFDLLRVHLQAIAEPR